MKKLGLIGYPLSHSFSKKYFEEKFRQLNITDHSYDLFPIESITELPSLLKKEKGLVGLNVTIPYKESVIPFVDELDETAKEIGAVNCIKITDGKLKGYNTDALGFRQSLRPFLDINHTKALIFGTGGASKAVAYTLTQWDIPFWYVSRNKNEKIANHLSYNEVDENIISVCRLLINTTPLGMNSHMDACVDIPYHAITPRHLAYDLIYNPAETLFLQKAKAQGALISNGYNMLCFQADEGWKIWNV